MTIGLVSCNGGSNNSTNHIEFMEIPVNGKVEEFGSKLATKGYEFYSDDDLYNQVIYFGVYLNKKATIRLDYEEESREITSARVCFDDYFPNLSKTIDEYCEKYGECKMEPKDGFVYYSWKVNGGRLCISTCDSPVSSISYYKKY